MDTSTSSMAEVLRKQRQGVQPKIEALQTWAENFMPLLHSPAKGVYVQYTEDEGVDATHYLEMPRVLTLDEIKPFCVKIGTLDYQELLFNLFRTTMWKLAVSSKNLKDLARSASLRGNFVELNRETQYWEGIAATMQPIPVTEYERLSKGWEETGNGLKTVEQNLLRQLQAEEVRLAEEIQQVRSQIPMSVTETDWQIMRLCN